MSKSWIPTKETGYLYVVPESELVPEKIIPKMTEQEAKDTLLELVKIRQDDMTNTYMYRKGREATAERSRAIWKKLGVAEID